MKQKTRIFIALAIIFVVAVVIITVDLSQRRMSTAPEPGSIPVVVNGKTAGYILPSSLSDMQSVSFEDAEEGKTQEGWLLLDAMNSAFSTRQLDQDDIVTVSSSSRNKSVDIPWGDITNIENLVMFDLSNKGTLKLVSKNLDYLDVRDEWVQDVDKVEVKR
jgi:hypothetical protein